MHRTMHQLRNQRGFTLIEMMVVLLILAILIAIAIPGFLAARRRAQNRQAQSSLRTALVAEKVYYADTEAYTTDVTALQAVESGLRWGTLDAAAAGVQVEAVAAAGQGVVLRSKSRTGTLFCLADMTREGAFSDPPYAVFGGGTFFSKREGAPDDCEGLVWETSSAGWN